MIGRVRSWLAIAAVGVLSACGSTAPTAPAQNDTSDSAAAGAAATPAGEFERRQRDRAVASSRKQQWSDAAIAWEVLTVLRPENTEYRARLAETQRQIDAAVAERLPLAAQAAQRADLDAATRQYLAVLVMQPSNAQAADALRALERERNRRSYLGKYSRNTLTRRAFAEAEMAPGGAPERPDVEHAAMLANDAQYDDAIALLEHQLVLSRRDTAARRLLANVYYRKADSLLPTDRPGALAALRKSVKLDPGEPTAAARWRELTGTVGTPVVAAAPNAAASGGAPAVKAAPR